MDSVSGRAARHTGALTELDPVVDGEERTWGQTDPDGYGVLPHVFPTDPPTGATTLVAVLRVDPIAPLVSQELRILNDGNNLRFWIDADADADSFGIVMPNGSDDGARNWAGDVNLSTGLMHVVVAHCGLSATRVWVDGREVRATVDAAAGWTKGANVEVGRVSVLGGSPSQRAYTGVIGHVIAWDSVTATTEDHAAFARELTAASRIAWAGQRLDERLSAIVAGMGAGELVGPLDGSCIVTHQGYRPADPLELLQTIEDTEQGRVWCDRQGQLRFSRRTWAWTDAVSTNVQATFTDDPDDLADGALPYLAAELKIGRDPRRTTNVAQVTSTHGRMQTVTDPASIALRGKRNAVHLSGLLHSSDRQSRAIAEFIIGTRSTPSTRVDRLSFNVSEFPDLLAPFAQQVDEGWLVQVNRKGVQHRAHVVGVSHFIGHDGWILTLALDLTRTGMTAFRADVSATDGTDVAVF